MWGGSSSDELQGQYVVLRVVEDVLTISALCGELFYILGDFVSTVEFQ